MYSECSEAQEEVEEVVEDWLSSFWILG